MSHSEKGFYLKVVKVLTESIVRLDYLLQICSTIHKYSVHSTE